MISFSWDIGGAFLVAWTVCPRVNPSPFAELSDSMRSWLSLSYGFCFIIVREAFPYVKPDNIYMPLLLSIFFATCQCQHYSTQISSSRLYNLTICSHDYHSFMIFLVWFQVRHLINLGIFACAIAVWQLLLTMFHWWWCYKQAFFPRLWHMRICGHDYHSFSTWTYLHVLLLFGNFCWPCFNGANAANRCLFPRLWHMRIWSHDYHSFSIFSFSFDLHLKWGLDICYD